MLSEIFEYLSNRVKISRNSRNPYSLADTFIFLAYFSLIFSKLPSRDLQGTFIAPSAKVLLNSYSSLGLYFPNSLTQGIISLLKVIAKYGLKDPFLGKGQGKALNLSALASGPGAKQVGRELLLFQKSSCRLGQTLWTLALFWYNHSLFLLQTAHIKSAEPIIHNFDFK